MKIGKKKINPKEDKKKPAKIPVKIKIEDEILGIKKTSRKELRYPDEEDIDNQGTGLI